MEGRARSAMGARLLVPVAAAFIIIQGLKEAQTVIIPVLLAAFLAILCAPLVAILQQRKIPTVVSVLIVVLAVMGALAGIGTILGGSVNDFTQAIPKYQSRFNGLVGSSKIWLIEQGVAVNTLNIGELADPGAIMGMIGGALGGLMAALSNTVLVLLTLVFILLEAAGFPAKIHAMAGAPVTNTQRYERMTRQVQQYLFIKTLLSLATGVLVAVWLAILGVDFPVLWGLIAFLLNYIPNLGSILAAIPAVLLALIQLGVGYFAAAAAGYLVVNVVIGNVIEPALLGRRLGLSTLVVFISLVFWGWIWGPVGMLLSVPLTMIIKIMLEHSPDLHWVSILLDSPAAIAESGPTASPYSSPPPSHPASAQPPGSSTPIATSASPSAASLSSSGSSVQAIQAEDSAEDGE